MAQGRIIIRNGRIVTMDSEIGNLEGADILIEDGTIVAVATGLDPTDAEVIDARGGIVAPGFIDTHRHTWQTQIRALCADWVLGDYVAGVRFTVAPAYTPDDVHLGNYAGGLEALDAGVTSVLDFSHCNNSPAHSDAALRGLRDSGVRGVFAYGFFESSPFAPVHFPTHADRIADFHRIADTFGPDDLVRVGVALSEPGMIPFDGTAAEVEAARARGALVVTHTGCVWALPTAVAEYEARDLLDENQVHVHCNTLSEEDWATLARHNAKISISPETELNMGMGRPAFAAARKHGMKPTLSADVVSLNSGDLFHQLRLGIAFARWESTEALNLAGGDPLAVTVTAHEALEWVTVNAAEALGLSGSIGSLTPGKRADIIIVEGRAVSRSTAVDPEALLVFQASGSDVRTVLVNGVVVKRDGALVGVDSSELDRRLEESAAAIHERLSGVQLPGTPPGGMFPAIAGMTIANIAGTAAHVEG